MSFVQPYSAGVLVDSLGEVDIIGDLGIDIRTASTTPSNSTAYVKLRNLNPNSSAYTAILNHEAGSIYIGTGSTSLLNFKEIVIRQDDITFNAATEFNGLVNIDYYPSTSNGKILNFTGYTYGEFRQWAGGSNYVEWYGRSTTPSDYRLKENIAPIENASSLIMSLKPCKYNFKEDNRLETGFIAHELAEVLPEFVTGEKDAVDEEGNIQAQSVEYGRMTGVLTAALQEALVKIDSLEARIKELEDKK